MDIEQGVLRTIISDHWEAVKPILGDHVPEEVKNAVDSLSSLIEPMVMVIIGGLVGSIVIAMYLPIFKLAMTVM